MLIDESMHVIYLDNAHIKLKLVHFKVPVFQKKVLPGEMVRGQCLVQGEGG